MNNNLPYNYNDLPGGTTRKDTSPKGRSVLWLVLILVALPLASVWFFILGPMIEERSILRVGVETRAVITAVEPTGNYYNNQPQVRFYLTLYPEGSEPYQGNVRTVVNPIFAPQVQPGSQITVVVDPNDKTRIAVP